MCVSCSFFSNLYQLYFVSLCSVQLIFCRPYPSSLSHFGSLQSSFMYHYCAPKLYSHVHVIIRSSCITLLQDDCKHKYSHQNNGEIKLTVFICVLGLDSEFRIPLPKTTDASRADGPNTETRTTTYIGEMLSKCTYTWTCIDLYSIRTFWRNAPELRSGTFLGDIRII